MNTATAALAPVIEPSFEIVQETPAPTWEHARDLLRQATQGAEAIIELSFVLVRLRNEFFAQGVGGGNFSRTSSARGGGSEKGWEKTVEEHLGIGAQRARRLMEKETLDEQDLRAFAGQGVRVPQSPAEAPA